MARTSAGDLGSPASTPIGIESAHWRKPMECLEMNLPVFNAMQHKHSKSSRRHNMESKREIKKTATVNFVARSAGRWLARLGLAACVAAILQASSAEATYVQHAGTNMFVIGIYDYAGNPPPIHNDVAHLAEMSNYCNTIAIYDHDWDDSAWQQNLTWLTTNDLNAAASNGIFIVDQMWTENYYGSNNVDNWMCMSPEYPAEYELKVGSSLYNQLTALSNSPALLMWENMDEVGVNWWNNEVPNPDYMDPTLTNYVDDGNFMLKYGGGKPVWVNDGCFFYQNGGNTTVSFCDSWAGGGTAYSQDCYPSSSSGNVDDIKKDMDFINLVISNVEGNSTDAVNLVVYTNLIAWQTPVGISGASDVATNGVYFGSWAPYDGEAGSLPVNGVTFQGFSDLPDFSNNFPSGNGGDYFNSPNTANANYNTLLGYATWANGSSAQFSWGGMTPGHDYEVQLWVEDCRNDATDARWENSSGSVAGSVSYGTDTSAATGYSAPLFSSPIGNPGYYILGTFVADNTGSEQILLTGWDASGNNPSAQINLFQVRDITPVAPARPDITGISLSGSDFIISGTNGTAGRQFAVLMSTNISLPLGQWTPIMTNTFSGPTFSISNAVHSGAPENFYVLELL